MGWKQFHGKNSMGISEYLPDRNKIKFVLLIFFVTLKYESESEMKCIRYRWRRSTMFKALRMETIFQV